MSSSDFGSAKDFGFVEYLKPYGLLSYQKEMLTDLTRMDAYYKAVFKNKQDFVGKTVLDVGTGTGILAIWTAQAGARKVYAVEGSKMADHARAVVKANNLEDVVEVIEARMEDAVLPEKVDVIISEWMGLFLLQESMLDSVIYARDRWLKTSGIMYPSHASIYVAPITDFDIIKQKREDYDEEMKRWHKFLKDTQKNYGVDMSVLTMPFADEQSKCHFKTSLFGTLTPAKVIGKWSILKEISCLTVTVDEIAEVRSDFQSVISFRDTKPHGFSSKIELCGFGGWFDVRFQGRKDAHSEDDVVLTTSPSEACTHWGQQILLVDRPIDVDEGDKLSGSFLMTRQKENHRLMEVRFQCKIMKPTGEVLNEFNQDYVIDQS